MHVKYVFFWGQMLGQWGYDLINSCSILNIDIFLKSDVGFLTDSKFTETFEEVPYNFTRQSFVPDFPCVDCQNEGEISSH
jgi:hypothetical protein